MEVAPATQTQIRSSKVFFTGDYVVPDPFPPIDVHELVPYLLNVCINREFFVSNVDGVINSYTGAVHMTC